MDSTVKKPKVVAIHPSSCLFKLENPPMFVLYGCGWIVSVDSRNWCLQHENTFGL